MKKFFVLFFTVALLTTSACGGKKKAGDNDDGDNGGPGGKPGTNSVTVTAEVPVEITDKEITFKAHDGKTVTKDGIECTLSGGDSDATVNYAVEGKKLTLSKGSESDSFDKISGAENSIWGEWNLGEKEENGGTIKLTMTFQEKTPKKMILKGTCTFPKK